MLQYDDLDTAPDEAERQRRALEELMGSGNIRTAGLPGGTATGPSRNRRTPTPGGVIPGDEPPLGGLPPTATPPPDPTKAVPNPSLNTDPLFDPSSYFADAARRGGDINPNSTASGAAKGAAIGSKVMPGYGTIVGAGVGALAGRATRKAATQPTDLSVEDARNILATVIRSEFGRDPNPGEIEGALKGQGWQPGDRWVGEQGLTAVINALHNNAGATPKPVAVTGDKAPDTPAPTTTPGEKPTPLGIGKYADKYGFPAARLNNPDDNDPKVVFGRFIQDWEASGRPWGPDAVKAFLASDPRWEGRGLDTNDPEIRVKQPELDKWKPGQSVWQDVTRASGPGGANEPQYINSAGEGGDTGGDPHSAAGRSSYAGTPFAGLSGDIYSDDFFQQLLAKLRGSLGQPENDAFGTLMHG